MDFKIGERVIIKSVQTKGTLAFIGNTHFSGGFWYGVILDEPKGKNNGSVDNIDYFKCPDGHGLFARKSDVKKLPSEDDCHVKRTKSDGARANHHSYQLEIARLKETIRSVEDRRDELEKTVKMQRQWLEIAQDKLVQQSQHESHLYDLKRDVESAMEEVNNMLESNKKYQDDLEKLTRVAIYCMADKETEVKFIGRLRKELRSAKQKVLSLTEELQLVKAHNDEKLLKTVAVFQSNLVKETYRVKELETVLQKTISEKLKLEYTLAQLRDWIGKCNYPIGTLDHTFGNVAAIIDRQDVPSKTTENDVPKHKTVGLEEDSMVGSECTVTKVRENIVKQNFMLRIFDDGQNIETNNSLGPPPPPKHDEKYIEKDEPHHTTKVVRKDDMQKNLASQTDGTLNNKDDSCDTPQEPHQQVSMKRQRQKQKDESELPRVEHEAKGNREISNGQSNDHINQKDNRKEKGGLEGMTVELEVVEMEHGNNQSVEKTAEDRLQSEILPSIGYAEDCTTLRKEQTVPLHRATYEPTTKTNYPIISWADSDLSKDVINACGDSRTFYELHVEKFTGIRDHVEFPAQTSQSSPRQSPRLEFPFDSHHHDTCLPYPRPKAQSSVLDIYKMSSCSRDISTERLLRNGLVSKIGKLGSILKESPRTRRADDDDDTIMDDYDNRITKSSENGEGGTVLHRLQSKLVERDKKLKELQLSVAELRLKLRTATNSLSNQER